MFTVPSGGDGYYYFSVHFAVWYYELALFDIQINGDTICTAWADRNNFEGTDGAPTSCSAASFAAEGEKHKITKQIYTCTYKVLLFLKLC